MKKKIDPSWSEKRESSFKNGGKSTWQHKLVQLRLSAQRLKEDEGKKKGFLCGKVDQKCFITDRWERQH